MHRYIGVIDTQLNDALVFISSKSIVYACPRLYPLSPLYLILFITLLLLLLLHGILLGLLRQVNPQLDPVRPRQAHAPLERLRPLPHLDAAALVADKVKHAVVAVEPPPARHAQPQEARVRDDEDVLFRPRAQGLEAAAAAGQDGGARVPECRGRGGRLVRVQGRDGGVGECWEGWGDGGDGGACVAWFRRVLYNFKPSISNEIPYTHVFQSVD